MHASLLSPSMGGLCCFLRLKKVKFLRSTSRGDDDESILFSSSKRRTRENCDAWSVLTTRADLVIDVYLVYLCFPSGFSSCAKSSGVIRKGENKNVY